MAKYLNIKDVKSLIEVAIEDNWELDYTLERLEEINPADVVERYKTNKVINQLTSSMNKHLSSDGTPIDEYAYCYLNALEILEENIG